MARWLWYFYWYSFLGFLLEVAFARISGHPKRDRKCLLLLPLCPVYGLGACLILWLAPLGRGPLWVAVSGSLSGLSFMVPWAYVALAFAMTAAAVGISVAYGMHRCKADNVVEALRMDSV